MEYNLEVRNFLGSILLGDEPTAKILDNLEELFSLIPELKKMVGFSHKHPHHHLDVWEHTLLAISKSLDNFDVRLSLLLHDIGKPICYQDGEVRHFKGHAECSSIMAREILERLGFSSEETEYICSLIALHDTPISDEQIREDRIFCEVLYQIQVGDALAHHPERLEKRIAYLEETKKRLNNNLSNKEK